MSLFADKKTDRMVNGFLIPASWFQVINSGFILLLAPQTRTQALSGLVIVLVGIPVYALWRRVEAV